jgi:hypothetical protein
MARIIKGMALLGTLEPGISPVHEQLLIGWIEGEGSAAGARNPGVGVVASVHHGAPVSGYRMRWSNG